MSGAATNAQIAAFLTALRMKGETVEKLIGFAQVMRQKAVRVRTRGKEVAALTHNDGDRVALFLIVQGGGLHYHTRTMGFSY